MAGKTKRLALSLNSVELSCGEIAAALVSAIAVASAVDEDEDSSADAAAFDIRGRHARRCARWPLDRQTPQQGQSCSHMTRATLHFAAF